MFYCFSQALYFKANDEALAVYYTMIKHSGHLRLEKINVELERLELWSWAVDFSLDSNQEMAEKNPCEWFAQNFKPTVCLLRL